MGWNENSLLEIIMQKKILAVTNVANILIYCLHLNICIRPRNRVLFRLEFFKTRFNYFSYWVCTRNVLWTMKLHPTSRQYGGKADNDSSVIDELILLFPKKHVASQGFTAFQTHKSGQRLWCDVVAADGTYLWRWETQRTWRKRRWRSYRRLKRMEMKMERRELKVKWVQGVKINRHDFELQRRKMRITW